MSKLIAIDEQLYNDVIDCLRNTHRPTIEVLSRLEAQPELGNGLRVKGETVELLRLVDQMWQEFFFSKGQIPFDPRFCDYILQRCLNHFREFLVKEVRGYEANK